MIDVAGRGTGRLVADDILAANGGRNRAGNGTHLANIRRKESGPACALAQLLKRTIRVSPIPHRCWQRDHVDHRSILVKRPRFLFEAGGASRFQEVSPARARFWLEY